MRSICCAGNLVVVLMVCLYSSASQASIDDDLQAYWRLDGGGGDATGHGYDLSLHGGLGYGSGLLGQALSFNKVNSQFANRPGSDAAFNFGANDFSIQAWVNYNSTATEQVLLEKFDGASGGWTLSKSAANELLFHTTFSLMSAPLSISTGAWHQVVVQRSGSTLNLLFDQNIVATTSFFGVVNPVSHPLLIGRRVASDARDFSMNGRLDEIAIWNRSLTSQEITVLYNEGAGALVPEPSTVVLAGFASLGLLATAVRAGRRQSQTRGLFAQRKS